MFDELMPTPNQIHRHRNDPPALATELLEIPKGTITEAGLRQNINVAILYIEAWLNGVGAAALYNLMEDAATAEISRAQVWQWLRHGAILDDGRPITLHLYKNLLAQEIQKVKAYVGDEYYQKGKFEQAITLFDQLVTAPNFAEFLTLPAYNILD
jgi:malate synthase